MTIDSTVNSTINSAISSTIGGTNGGAQFMASFTKRRIVTDDNVTNGVFPLSGSYANNIIETNSDAMIEIFIPNSMLLNDGRAIGVRMASNTRVCEVVADTEITVNGEVNGRFFYPIVGDMLYIVGRGDGKYDIINARRKVDSPREARVFPFILDARIPANINLATGTNNVTSYTDKGAFSELAACPTLNVAGSGAEITWDGSEFTFTASKYLSASNPAYFQNALSITRNCGLIVFADYNWEADQANGATVCHMHRSTNDRFVAQTRGQLFRAGHFNGTAWANRKHVTLPAYNATVNSRRSIIDFGYNVADVSQRHLRFNTGIISGDGSNPTAPSTTAGFAIGGETGGTRLFTGKISWLGIPDRQLNRAESYAVANCVANISFAAGAGQSNEAYKHITTAPWFRDGANAFIDYRNNQSPRNITYYFNCAFQGTSLSRKSNDGVGYGANNSWVDDRTATLADDFRLTAMKTNINSTLGLNKGLPFDIVIGNLENEQSGLAGGFITKAEIKTALQYMINSLKAEYPNARFWVSLPTKRFDSATVTDAIAQTMKDICYENIEANSSFVFFGADFSLEDMRSKDGLHYSAASYASQGVRMARRIYGGTGIMRITSALLSSTTLTLNVSHDLGSGFTVSDLLPVNNFLSSSNDFENWTALDGASVTANAQRSILGINNAADVLSKTGVTTAGLTRTVGGLADNFNFSLYVKAGSISNVTLGLSMDGGTTWRGRVEFGLTGNGSFVNRGSTNLVGTPVITKLDIAGDGDQWWRVSFAALLTAGTCTVAIYPDVAGGANAGNIVISYAQVTRGANLRTYAPLNGAQPFIRVFDDGVEVNQTAITASGSTITCTLASAPASGSVMEVCAGYGTMLYTQDHTIPRSNSNLQPPLQSSKLTFIAA
jgi:hypothetical protein